MPFKVIVTDNFHYMVEDERYVLGIFETQDLAVQASQAIIDKFLESAHRTDMSPHDLYKYYASFGEDPYIVASEAMTVPFSARSYAQDRCVVLCGATFKPNQSN